MFNFAPASNQISTCENSSRLTTGYVFKSIIEFSK